MDDVQVQSDTYGRGDERMIPVTADRSGDGRLLFITGARPVILGSLLLAGCGSGDAPAHAIMNDDRQEFANRYTVAWNSQDPALVASFVAEDGSLTVNDGAPVVGREAITDVARGFMTTFPDMVIAMDSLRVEGDAVEYHWTLTGTNTGPGGTGHAVRISGYEVWAMTDDGLIAESRGHFDEAEYQLQLEHG